jgi:hypothetical protein
MAKQYKGKGDGIPHWSELNKVLDEPSEEKIEQIQSFMYQEKNASEMLECAKSLMSLANSMYWSFELERDNSLPRSKRDNILLKSKRDNILRQEYNEHNDYLELTKSYLFEVSLQYFKCAMVLGKSEACTQLATITNKDYGDKGKELAKLLIAIGTRLDDKESININKQMLIHNPTLHQKFYSLSSDCAKAITLNAQKYGDIAISWEMQKDAFATYNNALPFFSSKYKLLLNNKLVGNYNNGVFLPIKIGAIDYIFERVNSPFIKKAISCFIKEKREELELASKEPQILMEEKKENLPKKPQENLEWQNIGQGGKITKIENKGEIFGEIYQCTIYQPHHFKVNGQHIVVAQYRSVTMPIKIKPGTEFYYEFALQDLHGVNMPKQGAKHFKISYDTKGELEKISVPSHPVASPNAQYAPVLVSLNKGIYTLPVTSGNYLYLVNKVRENGGVVVIENNEYIQHVQQVVFVPPPMQVAYQPVQHQQFQHQQFHHPQQVVHPVGEESACVQCEIF